MSRHESQDWKYAPPPKREENKGIGFIATFFLFSIMVLSLAGLIALIRHFFF